MQRSCKECCQVKKNPKIRKKRLANTRIPTRQVRHGNRGTTTGATRDTDVTVLNIITLPSACLHASICFGNDQIVGLLVCFTILLTLPESTPFSYRTVCAALRNCHALSGYTPFSTSKSLRICHPRCIVIACLITFMAAPNFPWQ